MTGKEVNDRYFDWLCKTAMPDYAKYTDILRKLHSTIFDYSIPHDENRAQDGMELRHIFGEETGISAPIIAACLDYKQCSVLEMLVALARRCDEQIMYNPKNGARTQEWFTTMLDNLGLLRMTNERYDDAKAAKIIDIFVSRAYDPDGKGNIFRAKGKAENFNTMEIWYQMCQYFSYYFD